jgi:succinate dehydrogenase hydrophobic anchor subunit
MLRIILHDIASFVLMMIFVLTMFGHALFMMLGTADPNSVGGFATVFGAMKTLYISMVTGVYDPDDFPDAYTFALSAVFLFTVVIVMLNVLIAIVSDSYDAAMVKSAQLFWSARMGLVAELSTTFCWILNTNILKDFVQSEGETSAVGRLFDRLFILCFEPKESVVLNVIGLCLLPVTFFLFCSSSFCYFRIFDALQFLAKQLIAITDFISDGVELNLGDVSSKGDEWAGRVLDIVRRINQHSTEKANETKSELAALKESDKQVRVELAAIKEMLSRIENRMGDGNR